MILRSKNYREKTPNTPDNACPVRGIAKDRKSACRKTCRHFLVLTHSWPEWPLTRYSEYPLVNTR